MLNYNFKKWTGLRKLLIDYTNEVVFHFKVLLALNRQNLAVAGFGIARKGKGNARIDTEIRSSLIHNRITVSMQYCPVK